MNRHKDEKIHLVNTCLVNSSFHMLKKGILSGGCLLQVLIVGKNQLSPFIDSLCIHAFGVHSYSELFQQFEGDIVFV